jgi:hypothetical protein
MTALTVTWKEFVKLQQLISVVKEGQDQAMVSGEATGDAGTVEWDAEQIEFTI